MNPATSVVLTGVIVTAGKWAASEDINIRIVAGGAVLAIGLAVMGEAQPELAGKFGALILLVAAFTYGPAIAWKMGLLDKTQYKTAPKWI